MLPFFAPSGPAARLGQRFRSLLWRPDLDEEIAGELAFHIEMLVRDYVARGLSPAAAAAAARRRFGDVAQVRRACRALGAGRDKARRRAQWLAETAHDLRLAGRRLRAQPAATLCAVIALAIGLAGAAAAWQVARATVRPLPFAAPGQLVRLRERGPLWGTAAVHGTAPAAGLDADLAVSPPAYADWRRAGGAFLGLAAFEVIEANLEKDGGDPAGQEPPPRRVLAARATASLLPLLGVRPELGRVFGVSEDVRPGARGEGADGRCRAAVLSHALWASRFAGDAGIVGRSLRLNGETLRVVGVMPAGFAAPAAPADIDVWLPLGLGPKTPGATRDHHYLDVVGRLRPGVEAAAVTVPLADAVPLPLADAVPLPLADAWAADRRWVRRGRLFLAAAGLLWLLATATAANLSWARTTARQREIDLRAVLGGGRGRIVRQLAAEAMLLAMLGAVAGLLVAGAATTLLRGAAAAVPQLAAMDAGMELAALPRLDPATAGVVLALALCSGLLCACGPALQALRPGLHETVRQSARQTGAGERRLRDALLVVELAVATTLVLAAGLLLASTRRVDRADPGFVADHVTSMRLALYGGRYPPAARRRLMATLEERLAALPGVAAAGFTSTAPLAAERPDAPFTLDACAPSPPAAPPASGAVAPLVAQWRVVTPGAFGALGIHSVAGRLLARGDGLAAHPGAVVDAALAELCWPGRDPLGQRLHWAAGKRDLIVVGVVDALRDLDLEADRRPAVFLPYDALPWRAMALVVRPAAAAGPLPAAAAALTAAIRRQVAALDPDLPLSPPLSLAVARRQALAGPRFGSGLLAIFAVAALGLAVSAVYACTAAAVVRRTAEIALRQALGAGRREVVRLTLRRNAWLIGLGLLFGALGSLPFGRLLTGLLFDTAAVRWPVEGAAALLVVAVATLASVAPALAATRLAPVAALRGD